MSIETQESKEPTFKELVDYLEVLGNGYVKPDLATEGRVQSGVVRDTKKYFPYIDAINQEMCKRAGITFPPNSINRRELD